MSFDLEKPLASLNEQLQSESTPLLFATESHHMPENTHFHASFRGQAIFLISQTQLSCNFDQFVQYLALNYFDRFLSKQEIPEGKPWVLRLLVISCISLAAKMMNEYFPLSDFWREEEGFEFDIQTINRMELLVLDVLSWRMRSITPFSFVNLFMSLFKLNEPPLIKALKERALDIIFKSHHEVKMLEFKPSIVAASALLSAVNELCPTQFHINKVAILSCEYVNKESLLECLDSMQEMVVKEEHNLVSNMKTPSSMVECGCIKMGMKRRKVIGLCNRIRVPYSQIQQG